jgi:hypothetical protein
MPVVKADIVGTEDVDVDLIPHRTHEEIMARLANAPTVKYPKEYMDWLDREVEQAKAELAAGEIYPQNVADYFAQLGITD